MAGDMLNGFDPKSFGVGLAKSLAAGYVASAAYGGRVVVQQVATDAFGNALGGSIAESTQPRSNFGSEKVLAGLDAAIAVDMTKYDANLREQTKTLIDGVKPLELVDTYFDELKQEFALPADFNDQLIKRWANEPTVSNLDGRRLALPALSKIPVLPTLMQSPSTGNFGSFVELSRESREIGDAIQQREIAFKLATGPQLVPRDPQAEAAREAHEQGLRIDMGLAAAGPVFAGYAMAARRFGAPNDVVDNLATSQTGLVGSIAGIPASQSIGVGPRGNVNVQLDGVNLNAKPDGTQYEGTVFRLETPSRVDTTFDAHAGNISASHRYSRSGEGAVYGATSTDTAFSEVEHYGLTAGRVSVSRNVALQNVLDLTNPMVRQDMNVSLGQITGDSYLVTHQLGSLARSNGYDGILAPSARNTNGSNLIIFPKVKK